MTAFYSEITSSVNDNGAAEVVCLNFDNTFNTGSFNILIDKLMKYKLSGQWGGLETSWTAGFKGLWSAVQL